MRGPKKKDRLAAVSPKSDQVFWLGGCLTCSVLSFPAPAKQTQPAEAAGEEWRITSGRCDGHNATSNADNADIRNIPAAAHSRSQARNSHYSQLSR